MEGLRVIEKIVALLEQIDDEDLLERIYWHIERLLVDKVPKS